MVGYYILGVSIAINFLIGLLVVSQNIKNRKNRLFLAAAAFFTLLTLANTLSLDTSLDQLFFIRTVMFSTTLSIFMLYMFILSLQSDRLLQKSIVGWVAALTLLVGLLDWTPLLFSGYTPGSPPTPTPNIGLLVFLFHFVVVTGLAVTSLWRGRKKATIKQRQQYNYILIGLAPILLFAPLTSIILPQTLGISELIVISPLYTMFFVVCVGYAIMRYGLFDVKQAVVRSLAYGLSILILAGIYYLLAYLVSITFFENDTIYGLSVSPINIFLALVLAFIFQPVKRFFDKITDSIFFRNRYDSDEFYARLSEVLTSTTDLRVMLKCAALEIGETLKAEQSFFVVQYNHINHVSAGTEHHSALPMKDVHRLNEYVTTLEGEVIITGLLPEKDEIHRLLVSHNVAVLMPLRRGVKIIGYLALGDQRSNGYTKRDMKVLTTISDELVIAIQNTLSVQEVKDINMHLEQRIDAATKELRRSNTQLRHLDTTKDEFLSMASHQLRTPLTSVKGYLSMVLEGDAGKITPTQEHLLSEAYTSSERMVHLIHDFLNVSRLQTGKFMLEQRPIDLVKLVGDEVKTLQRIAESRKMKLVFSSKGDIPILNIDENKIQQVVMNYIDNALFYSHEDTTIKVSLQVVGETVELQVKDAGIGVPKSEQKRLFTKFYRASNARRQRPDGTGVGLFLAKKVIDAHGGDVLFETVEGRGSTFGFSLPLKKLKVEPLENELN